MATVIYKNTSKDTLIVLGLGELEPGAQVSLTSEYLPQINLANYPGLVDVTAEEKDTE